ncbi:hypothetical protein chiPu_0020488, partial [Chiloscyllium punctatum]|nr:hypothetical protein [Chiloscyllium punctatum]
FNRNAVIHPRTVFDGRIQGDHHLLGRHLVENVAKEDFVDEMSHSEQLESHNSSAAKCHQLFTVERKGTFRTVEESCVYAWRS